MNRSLVAAIATLGLGLVGPLRASEPGGPADRGFAPGARHCWPGHPCLRGVVIHRVCLSREEGDGERRCLRWGRRI